MVSNALLKSKNKMQHTFCLSMFRSNLFCNVETAVKVENFFLNPCCLFDNNEFILMYVIIWLCAIFSIIFEELHNIDTGL